LTPTQTDAALGGPSRNLADPRPVGVFDSGFGGLTVARALIDLLPNEQLVYVGDTARYPYGPRPADEVMKFSCQIARHLVEAENVKMLVVACNTASSVSLERLREELRIPVVGVIEPGLRAAAKATTNGVVGVVGTVGTVASGAYQRAASTIGQQITLVCQACPGLVEFVERGETSGDQVHVLVERLLQPLKQAGVDTLLLGCTHYPYLARTIGDVMGQEVVLVSSADETAFDVRSMIEAMGTGAPAGRGSAARIAGRLRWYSTGDVAWFAQMGRRLLGPELEDALELRLDDTPH
jgi:glutamate racemase